MNKKKFKHLAKKINYENPVKLNFIYASQDHFCYLSEFNILEVSVFFHKNTREQLLVYLTHEIGHMHTFKEYQCMYMSDYTAEYKANRWALQRLEELKWDNIIKQYQVYLKDLAELVCLDEIDLEYKEAAVDLLLELEIK